MPKKQGVDRLTGQPPTADAGARHQPLTDRGIRALVPRDTPTDLRDGGLRGLIVTVLPSGRRQFSVRYRFRGTQRRFILGDYPDVTLAEARKRARRAQAAIDDGHDPAGDRRTAKAPRTDLVSALVEHYLAKHARTFKRSADEDERILTVNVLPYWRDRSVRDLTRRDVRALVERVVDRGSPIMANRTLADVRTMLNFAVDHDWIDANPASRIKKPAPEFSRDRVLSEDELRRLWRLLERLPTTAERPAPGRKGTSGDPDDPICPVSPRLAALVKVRLLLAQRGGETARMRWRDLDLEAGWWTIPATDTKNGEPHRVPLTVDAAALIRAQAGDEAGESVFARGATSVVDRAKKAPARFAKALGIEFRGHDLRRTAATGMAAAGVPREHIARVLNHVDGTARATNVYDRHSYDREKRTALEAWARRLDAILDGTPNVTVVPFVR